MSVSNRLAAAIEESVDSGRISSSFFSPHQISALFGESDLPIKKDAYEVLHFSRDKDLKIYNDTREAKVYHEDEFFFDPPEAIKTQISSKEMTRYVSKPKRTINLSIGSSNYKRFTRDNSNLESVTGTKIMALKNHEVNKNEKTDFDIFASRHSIVDLISLRNGTGKKLHVVLYDDQIFIESDGGGSYGVDPSGMCGHNIVELLTTPLNREAKSSEPIFTPAADNSVKFNSLVKHEFPKLKTSILISNEISAIKRPSKGGDGDEGDYALENILKLKCQVGEMKVPAALVQCYLAGTPELVLGIKSGGYCLRKIIKYSVKEELSVQELSQEYLDKYLGFVTSFIKRMAFKHKKPKPHSKTCFILSRDSMGITMKPAELSDSQIDKTLSSLFVKFRETMEKAKILHLTYDEYMKKFFKTEESSKFEKEEKPGTSSSADGLAESLVKLSVN